MTRSNDHDPDAPELRSLQQEVEPPADLEERTVSALHREGLLRDGHPGSRHDGGETGSAAGRRAGILRAVPFAWRVVFASVLAVGLLGAGLVAGRWTAAAVPPEPDYLLVLRAAAPERQAQNDEQTLVGEYSAWARQEAQAGRLVAGEKLSDGGRLLAAGPAGPEALPITAAGVEEGSVQGYFLIRSSSYEEAVRLASRCPHLKYGGTIELRRVDHVRGPA